MKSARIHRISIETLLILALVVTYSTWFIFYNLASEVQAQTNLRGIYTPPPDRLSEEDKARGFWQKDSCPPVKVIDEIELRLAPDAEEDRNVGGGGARDYFMGEWKFAKDQEDLIVRLWCIDGIFYSLEIITSKDLEETPRISPDAPHCPYVGGRNLSSGFEIMRANEGGEQDLGDELLPNRIDWISWDKFNTNPNEAAKKTIHFVRADQTVATGRITLGDDGSFEFNGRFVINGNEYDGVELQNPQNEAQEDARDQAIDDFTLEFYNVVRAHIRDPAADVCDNDVDADHVYNAGDNCPTITNPEQLDRDMDGIGDACEPFGGSVAKVVEIAGKFTSSELQSATVESDSGLTISNPSADRIFTLGTSEDNIVVLDNSELHASVRMLTLSGDDKIIIKDGSLDERYLITGQAGDDSITLFDALGSGNDQYVIFGHVSNDKLEFIDGMGNDRVLLIGGPGDDTIILRDVPSKDRYLVDCGSGNDKLIISDIFPNDGDTYLKRNCE